MKLFIDIDGVLVVPRQGNGPFNLMMKEHLDEFIIWAVANFECYWLTGWAPNGHTSLIELKLLPFLPADAKAIKVGLWTDLKTEALRPDDKDWIWIDDNLLPKEQDFLEANGYLDNFIRVDPLEPSLKHVMSRINHVRHQLEGS